MKHRKVTKIVKDKILGYYYFMDKTHPLSDKKGRVWYHRHVASISLGRWLTKEEVVHHKDEVRSNNEPSNLEVMTRREHGELHNPPPGLLVKMSKGRVERLVVLRDCVCCGTKFRPTTSRQKFCSPECSSTARRIIHPKIEADVLTKLIWAMPTTQIAKELGVSDTAIAKFCKKHKISKPPRGYWAGRR